VCLEHLAVTQLVLRDLLQHLPVVFVADGVGQTRADVVLGQFVLLGLQDRFALAWIHVSISASGRRVLRAVNLLPAKPLRKPRPELDGPLRSV